MSAGSAIHELERLTDIPFPDERYRERRIEELAWVGDHGWADALLSMLADVRAAQAIGVLVGPASGSTHASLLLWCLGIARFDPVAYGLPPSTFYKETDSASGAHARWTVSAEVPGATCLDADPMVAALAQVNRGDPAEPGTAAYQRLAESWCALDPDHVASGPEPPEGGWSATACPDARWIFARRHDRGFEDLVTAFALARPGPAGCGMLTAYLQAAPVEPEWPLLACSRGLPVFREQLHAIGHTLLGLGIDDTLQFARDVTTGDLDGWRDPLRAAVASHGGCEEEADTVLDLSNRWAPYLYPRAHALGRAWLLVRCAHHDGQKVAR